MGLLKLTGLLTELIPVFDLSLKITFSYHQQIGMHARTATVSHNGIPTYQRSGTLLGVGTILTGLLTELIPVFDLSFKITFSDHQQIGMHARTATVSHNGIPTYQRSGTLLGVGTMLDRRWTWSNASSSSQLHSCEYLFYSSLRFI